MGSRKRKGWPGIGRIVAARSLRVDVKVLDVRWVYGRYEVLVKPVAGVGRTWVRADRVKVVRG
jgi:hypothetical protein